MRMGKDIVESQYELVVEWYKNVIPALYCLMEREDESKQLQLITKERSNKNIRAAY